MLGLDSATNRYELHCKILIAYDNMIIVWF
jgi:hypothetical protein